MATKENRCFSPLDHKENITFGGKEKIDRRNSGLYEGAVRKRLHDISNFPKQPKFATGTEKAQFFPNTEKLYIHKLQQENASLLKLVEDKNKIIEASGSELQKLIVNMQKMQQQNFQLAQANSLMLADLNACKERLKAMQHQLGCTNSLLRVKEMEQKEKLSIRTCQQCENQAKVGTRKSEKDVLEIVEADKNPSNLRSTNYKRQKKSQSLGHSTVKHVDSTEKTEDESVCLRTHPASFKPEEAEPKKEDTVLLKEKAENKRGRLRRNSAIFRPEEPKPKEEDICKITNTAKLPECPSSLDGKEGSIGQGLDSNVVRRSSIARPSRLAAKKVQSYKENPINVKMRRPDMSSIIWVMIDALLEKGVYNSVAISCVVFCSPR